MISSSMKNRNPMAQSAAAGRAISPSSQVYTGPPTEFLFDHNFDEKGALYYLGSFGKQRNWQNPHVIGLVQAFASSMA